MRTAKTNNVETKNVKEKILEFTNTENDTEKDEDESEIVNDSNDSNDDDIIDDIDETILGIYLSIKEDEEINLCLRK
jgi:hypothetical protein